MGRPAKALLGDTRAVGSNPTLSALNRSDVMSIPPPDRRRESFDEAAPDYNLYRSGYPDTVVTAVITTSRLRPGSRVLEIGCGTGQLTVPLAQYGAGVVAVEHGPNLAALARQNLAGFANVEVEVGAFEDWPPPHDPFDAVVSASAFHWLDPEVRYSKSARVLKPRGRLTILHAHHVRGGTPGFFEDTQPFYMKWGLSDDPFFRPPRPADVPTTYPELAARPEFAAVEWHRFEIPRHHTTETYVGWLKTDSLVASLDKHARRGFLADIAKLIETSYHGAVERNFVYEVVSAERRF